MGKTYRTFTTRIEENLLGLFDSKVGENNRNKMLTKLMQDFVNGGKKSEEKIKEVEASVKDQKLDGLVSEALLEVFKAKGKEVFGELDNETIAKLAISRLPKIQNTDESIEANLISLEEAQNRLPNAEDLTKELSELRGIISKLYHERELEQILIDGLHKRLNRDEDGYWDKLKEFIKETFKKSREYREECEARDIEFEQFKILVKSK